MIINQNHPFLSYSDDMVELSKPLSQLGITYFTYIRSYDTGERVYLITHREVLNNYLKNKWYLSGNIEGTPNKYKSQIVYWSTLPKQDIFDNNERAHGLDHGIFIIEPHATYCDFYGFATNKENHWIHNVYLNKIEALKRFTLDFKDKASAIIHKSESSKIVLPHHNDSIDFFGNEIETEYNFVEYRKKFSDIRLTDRQLVCAYLLTQGNTNKEIANYIGLSPRTIEDHINTLKRKFYCRNKSELIVTMIEVLNK